MAAVPVVIIGTLTGSDGKTDQVTLNGMLGISGLEVGGGPILPSGPPNLPIHPIWGPPGFNPPGPGMPPGIWGGPIIPDTPPPIKPPDFTPPPPGTVVIPPGNQPVQPIVAPDYIIVFYPGVGWVIVGKPLMGSGKK